MACATVVGDNTATTANAAAEHQQGQEDFKTLNFQNFSKFAGMNMIWILS
jgi:hypothetical protein